MKFNKRYLNHNFKSIGNPAILTDFICLVCGIKGYYLYNNKKYLIQPNYIELDLTCEEQQIKNILE